MGSEFLRTGYLHVYRTDDAEEFKFITQGGWPLAKVKEEAERLFQGIEEARIVSPLPSKPDEEAANCLLMEMHRALLKV
jgi:hypothetical protein